MPDVPSYRSEPDAGFADRLEGALLERLAGRAGVVAADDAAADILVADVTHEEPGQQLPVRPAARVDTRHRRRVGGGVAALAVAAAAVVGVVIVTDSDPIAPTDTLPPPSATSAAPVTSATTSTVAAPVVPFVGEWTSATEPDGSVPAMRVTALPDGQYEIVVTDDPASVCSGAPSTMRGTGQIDAAGALVIPQPVLTCDDGTTPVPLNGPPLQAQIANMRFVYDATADTLTNGSIVWWREGSDPPLPAAMWPQSTIDEVREAQRLADTGAPNYTWQLSKAMTEGEIPAGAQLFERFLLEKYGWSGSYCCFDYGTSNPGSFSDLVFVRCAAGVVNPLYPDDETGSRCAPTIDDTHYEAVRLGAQQLDRRGETGIWVVTDWEEVAPQQQVVPPTDAEVDALMSAFLGARVAGSGAEQYLSPAPDPLPHLLYATTSGAPYERFEYDVTGGPHWPAGVLEVDVRLFADGGQTVVEQSFIMDADGNRERQLQWKAGGWDGPPTTENGAAIPEPYSFLDGAVTFAAAYPWIPGYDEPSSTMTSLVYNAFSFGSDGLVLSADPIPVGSGCRAGPEPADAADLARIIQADPDFEVTAPVVVQVGGVDALMMDIAPAVGASTCDDEEQPRLFADDDLNAAQRMRVYVLDMPGEPARTLAIVVRADADVFAQVADAAGPVIDSIQFGES